MTRYPIMPTRIEPDVQKVLAEVELKHTQRQISDALVKSRLADTPEAFQKNLDIVRGAFQKSFPVPVH